MPTDELVLDAERLGDLVNGHPEHVADVVPRLVTILTATDRPRVVRAVVEALGHAWHPSAASALLSHVAHDHPDPQVRLALAQALPGGIDDEGDLRDRVVVVLTQLTRDPETPVRDWAAFGLGQLQARSPAARDALAALLADPDHATRSEALLALACAADERALPALRLRLGHHEELSLLELEAAVALAAPELHPALRQLAEDWAADRDEFTELLATALARCAPDAAATARQVEEDVLTRVRPLVGATKQVELRGDYPGTALVITGGRLGEDLSFPLWDEGQRPGAYDARGVLNAVRGSFTPPQS